MASTQTGYGKGGGGGTAARGRAATPPARVAKAGTKTPPASTIAKPGGSAEPKPAVKPDIPHTKIGDFMKFSSVLSPRLVGKQLISLWSWCATAYALDLPYSVKFVRLEEVFDPTMLGLGMLFLSVAHFSVPPGGNPAVLLAHVFLAVWQGGVLFLMLHLAGFVQDAASLPLLAAQNLNLAPSADSWYDKLQGMVDTTQMCPSLYAFMAALAAQVGATVVSFAGCLWYVSTLS